MPAAESKCGGMAKVILPIPTTDFDPTEVAVPWRELTGRGHEVVFATPDGAPGRADELMLTGEGLDPWGFIPGLAKLTLVGRILRANHNGRAAYERMVLDPGFRRPMRWQDVTSDAFDGLVLPGGHRARGMRVFLESPVIQRLATEFFRLGKPVGAICHGVLVLARSADAETRRSVLYGRRTTALTWRLEKLAASLARATRWWDPNYYRTYREAVGQGAGYMSVQQEVTRALRAPADFLDAPPDAPRRQTSGLVRDSDSDLTPAFVVRDGAYVSARWPGDAHLFAKTFADVLVGR